MSDTSSTASALDPSQFTASKSTPTAARSKGTLNPDEFVSQSVAVAAAGKPKAGNVGLVDPKSARTFFRVRPGEEWHRFGIDVLFYGGSDVTRAVLIHPEFQLPAEYDEFVRSANLFLVHDHKSATNFYVFPDSSNSWHVSRYEIAVEAETVWVKMRSDRANNQYVPVFPPMKSELYVTEPKWPDATFAELFTMAFSDKLITSVDDPILKSLSGMTYGS